MLGGSPPPCISCCLSGSQGIPRPWVAREPPCRASCTCLPTCGWAPDTYISCCWWWRAAYSSLARLAHPRYRLRHRQCTGPSPLFGSVGVGTHRVVYSWLAKLAGGIHHLAVVVCHTPPSSGGLPLLSLPQAWRQLSRATLRTIV